MLRSLGENDVPWLWVDAAFDWSVKPSNFMSIERVCVAAGFSPTHGNLVSVSRFLGRKKIQRIKVRGERGAVMPPLRAKGSK